MGVVRRKDEILRGVTLGFLTVGTGLDVGTDVFLHIFPVEARVKALRGFVNAHVGG